MLAVAGGDIFVAVFSARIQEVLQAQRDLAETLALKDVDVRAERLGRVA